MCYDVIEKVNCLYCDKEVREFYVSFFKDREGNPRYGALCPKCKEELGEIQK
jgi:hypothetical protein